MNYVLESMSMSQPLENASVVGRPRHVVELGDQAVVVGRIAGEYRLCLVDSEAGEIQAFVDLPGWRVNDVCQVGRSGLIAVARGEYDGGFDFEGDLLLWDPGSGTVERLLRDCGSVLSCEPSERGGLRLRLSPLDDEEVDGDDYDLDWDEEDDPELLSAADRRVDEAFAAIVAAQGPGGSGVTPDLMRRMAEARQAAAAEQPPWDESQEVYFSYDIKPSRVLAGKTLKMKPKKRIRGSGFGEESIRRRERERSEQAVTYLASAMGLASPPLQVTSMVGMNPGVFVVGYEQAALRIWEPDRQYQEVAVSGTGPVTVHGAGELVLVIQQDPVASDQMPAPTSDVYLLTGQKLRFLRRFENADLLVDRTTDGGLSIDVGYGQEGYLVSRDGQLSSVETPASFGFTSFLSEVEGGWDRMLAPKLDPRLFVEHWTCTGDDDDDEGDYGPLGPDRDGLGPSAVVGSATSIEGHTLSTAQLRAQADWTYEFDSPVLEITSQVTPGRGVVAAAANGEGIVLDAESGEEIGRLHLNIGNVPVPITHVALSGDFVAAISTVGPPRVWRIAAR